MTATAQAPVPGPIGAAIVAGVPVDSVTLEGTLEIVDSFVEAGRATGRTFQIVTVNVDFVVTAQRDPDAQRILRQAELCLPDGMPVLWHARLSGTPLQERVAGADLVPAIVARSVSSGHRVLLFGSAEGVAERAADVLTERYPGATVRGISGPFMSDVRQMEPRYVNEIRAFRADVVCVALGNPKQEKWIDAHRGRLGASVLIGVGGTLDFLVGGRRRAPVWMQRAGLEWIFRAAQEPGRLGRRYLHDARVFGPHLARAGRERLVRSASSPTGAMTNALAAGSGDVIDLAGVDTLGRRDVARLMGRARDLRRAGNQLTIRGATSSVRRSLAEIGAEGVIEIR